MSFENSSQCRFWSFTVESLAEARAQADEVACNKLADFTGQLSVDEFPSSAVLSSPMFQPGGMTE